MPKPLNEMNLAELAALDLGHEKNIVFPLKHNAAGWICDANASHIMDIRGWGRIQRRSDGGQIHDAIAEQVVKILNEWYENNSK